MTIVSEHELKRVRQMNQFTAMMANSNFEGLMNPEQPNQNFDQSQAAFLQQNQPPPNHIPHKVEFTVRSSRFLDSFFDLSHSIRNFVFQLITKCFKFKRTFSIRVNVKLSLRLKNIECLFFGLSSKNSSLRSKFSDFLLHYMFWELFWRQNRKNNSLS